MIWDSFFKRRKVEFQYDNTDQEQSQSRVVNDLEFIDYSRSIFATHPVQLAKDVEIYSRKIVEERGKKFTFPLCPGIYDYSKMGYIIPAWTDIHIKANRAGSTILIGGNGKNTPFDNPRMMDTDILEGFFNFEGTQPNAWNVSSPWKVFVNKKNISAFLLPAVYHSKFEIFDNLYVVPGVVDYGDFHIVNFICCIKKKCEFTIKTGEPLLHFIPFVNDNIVCGYGPPNEEQNAEINYDPIVHQNHFYRKKLQTKKVFELTEPNKEESN